MRNDRAIHDQTTGGTIGWLFDSATVDPPGFILIANPLFHWKLIGMFFVGLVALMLDRLPRRKDPQRFVIALEGGAHRCGCAKCEGRR